MQLELKQLRINGGTQPREQIDEATVADYAEHLREGSTFPPVVAFFDGCVYWLADGFHRYHAHRRAGRDTIEADVREGGLREAVLYSVGANADHGLRRTNADKRKAVKTMLTAEIVTKNDEGNPWSDREIARRCRVDHTTVGRIRAELSLVESTSEKTGKNPANRSYVTKHGTRSVMKTQNIGKGKTNPKRKWGELSPKADKPVLGHSVRIRQKALDLPYDPPSAARALYSAFEEDFIRILISELENCLKGASYDPREDIIL